MDNKSLSHTKWKCQYHIVFIPKYRKKQLYGQIKVDVREIISVLCKLQIANQNGRFGGAERLRCEAERLSLSYL